MKKHNTPSLLEELAKAKPSFDPPLDFGPHVKKYKGKLTLNPLVQFRVSVNRQSGGRYIARGTISLLDPNTGYLLQPSDDRLAEINVSRQKKKKKPITSSHDFASAAQKELYVKVNDVICGTGEATDKMDIQTVDCTKAAQTEALRLADDLVLEYESNLCNRLSTNINVYNIPLGILLMLFGSAYLDSRTKSESQQAEYLRHLKFVSGVMGLTPVGNLTNKRLSKLVETNPGMTVARLSTLDDFLNYVARYRGCENPLATVITAVIDKIPRERNIPKLRDSAILPTSLTEDVEKKINQKLLTEFNANAAGMVLIKEGHLDPEDVCKATFGMLDISSTDPDRIFFLLRKDNYTGATHDYSFPLLPFGVYYLKKYMDHLKKEFGEARIESNKYILSASADGNTPIDTRDLNRYCKETIDAHPFGYAARANISPKRNSSAVELLHNTYYKRLIEACGLGRDRGALMFMTHKALAKFVQADCYRGFTDKTGKDYLYQATRRDRRGIPSLQKEKRRRSARYDKTSERWTTNCPSALDGFASTSKISLQGLKPGDIVEIHAEHGCYVSCLPPSESDS